MVKIKVLRRQSILDLAIQHTGSVSNAFLIAKENSLAASAYLVPGYELVIPEAVAFDREIKNYYSAKQIKPATGTAKATPSFGIDLPVLGGIGYMQIGATFKVS